MAILENSVRRRIIKYLSQEPGYPLQMAKELGLGQQLIAKHLNIMEAAGVVTSAMKASPCGPKRKTYLLSKSVSVAVDVAPHHYSARVSSFNEPQIEKKASETYPLMRKVKDIQRSQRERSIVLFEELLAEIDSRLERLENERSVLLYIRNHVMMEAQKIIENMEKTKHTKRILHYILDGHSRDVDNISKNLNLRESETRQILAELKKDLIDF